MEILLLSSHEREQKTFESRDTNRRHISNCLGTAAVNAKRLAEVMEWQVRELGGGHEENYRYYQSLAIEAVIRLHC